MTNLSAKLKNLILALFLCVGMIGLSGAGIGPTCTEKAAKECGCCPMEVGEPCCSAADDALPIKTPLIPPPSPEQQVFQGIQFDRPVLLMLPAPADLPALQDSVKPSLNREGPSLQALLCVRTV